MEGWPSSLLLPRLGTAQLTAAPRMRVLANRSLTARSRPMVPTPKASRRSSSAVVRDRGRPNEGNGNGSIGIGEEIMSAHTTEQSVAVATGVIGAL